MDDRIVDTPKISPVTDRPGVKPTITVKGMSYSATATDNGEAGGGLVLGEEVAIGGTIWGNLTGAVPYLCYANITDYTILPAQ